MWILQVETFWGLVPVCANALTCKLYFILSLVKSFAQAKVCNLNFPIMENYILGLQVVVDYSLFLIVQILYPREDLRDYKLGFLLLDLFVLLQIVVQIWPRAKFKDGAERIVVYFHRVIVFHHSPISKFLMDFVLT